MAQMVDISQKDKFSVASMDGGLQERDRTAQANLIANNYENFLEIK